MLQGLRMKTQIPVVLILLMAQFYVRHFENTHACMHLSVNEFLLAIT